MDSKLFDKRVVMRNISKRLISRQDYEKHLKGLADLTEQSESIDISLYGDDKEDEEAGQDERDSDGGDASDSSETVA